MNRMKNTTIITLYYHSNNIFQRTIQVLLRSSAPSKNTPNAIMQAKLSFLLPSTPVLTLSQTRVSMLLSVQDVPTVNT